MQHCLNIILGQGCTVDLLYEVCRQQESKFPQQFAFAASYAKGQLGIPAAP